MVIPMNPEAFENLRLELRRGCLVLAVLAALRSEQYGYTLRKTLSERGLEIDEGTLYPLLRRLESQGLLDSEWRRKSRSRSPALDPHLFDCLTPCAASHRAYSRSSVCICLVW